MTPVTGPPGGAPAAAQGEMERKKLAIKITSKASTSTVVTKRSINAVLVQLQNGGSRYGAMAAVLLQRCNLMPSCQSACPQELPHAQPIGHSAFSPRRNALTISPPDFAVKCNKPPSLCDKAPSLPRGSMRRCEFITFMSNGVGPCNSQPIIILHS
jgi:hypothetical protein